MLPSLGPPLRAGGVTGKEGVPAWGYCLPNVPRVPAGGTGGNSSGEWCFERCNVCRCWRGALSSRPYCSAEQTLLTSCNLRPSPAQGGHLPLKRAACHGSA